MQYKRKLKMGKFAINWEAIESKRDIPSVQLWYPRNEGNAKEIDIELSDVRATDGIRISYDFHRGGWIIKQASKFDVDDICDQDWQEVAFIKSWGRENG